MEEVKTSAEWLKLIPSEFKFRLMDPDGWDRTNWEYSFNEELITKAEFMNRLMSSTVICHNSFFNSEW